MKVPRPAWAAASVAVSCVAGLTAFAAVQVSSDPDNAHLGALDTTLFVTLLSLGYSVLVSPVIVLLACIAGLTSEVLRGRAR